MCISEHIHAQRHISIYFPWDYSSPGTDTNFHHFIKQSRGSLPRYTFQREPTFVASHSLNITYNSVYNQCCTVCGCPEGASTQNIVCHYVRLGCRLGTIAWKKCYFQKQSFPTQQRHIQAISCVFCLRDFRCEGICHGSQRCIKQQRQTSSQAETTNFRTFAITFVSYRLSSCAKNTILKARHNQVSGVQLVQLLSAFNPWMKQHPS